jgi:hypothetical protein
MHTEMPVWTGTVEIPTHPENEDNGSMLYSEISALLQTANEKLSQSHYDLLLLAGDCDAEDLRALRGFAARAELLNPWQQRAVEISPRMMGRQMALTTDGHRWAAALGGATMLLENTGMNLATTTVNLNREFPLLRPVQHQQTVSRAIQQAGQWLGSAGWSLVRQQRYILAASLLISLFAIGYRYYNISNQLADLDSALQRETQRALVVADVQAKYDAYSKKTHQIQAQITAINAIRQKQLTVGTVLQEIDKRVPAGLVFGNVEIRETTVKIKGYAPERAAVFTFANRLGQSFGVFGDVVPVYDDKTNVGNYEIQCRYLGPIPTNELPTPRAAAALDPGLSLIKPSN